VILVVLLGLVLFMLGLPFLGSAAANAGRSDASTRPVPPCVGGSIGAY